MEESMMEQQERSKHQGQTSELTHNFQSYYDSHSHQQSEAM